MGQDLVGKTKDDIPFDLLSSHHRVRGIRRERLPFTAIAVHSVVRNTNACAKCSTEQEKKIGLVKWQTINLTKLYDITIIAYRQIKDTLQSISEASILGSSSSTNLGSTQWQQLFASRKADRLSLSIPASSASPWNGRASDFLVSFRFLCVTSTKVRKERRVLFFYRKPICLEAKELNLIF